MEWRDNVIGQNMDIDVLLPVKYNPEQQWPPLNNVLMKSDMEIALY